MIPRYSNPEIARIWSDENRWRIWLEVELNALDGMASAGLIPKEAAAGIRKKADFSPKRIAEIEAEVKHDVIAFLTSVSEHAGASARYVHRGMTSNDVLDTALAVQLTESAKLIRSRLNDAPDVVKKRAEEFRHAPCVGRSHGIHAEPVTFGIKLIGWYAELKRNLRRFEYSSADVAVGKLSGAVGMYAGIPPEVEHYVMQKMGLKAETVATQVVQRDRHAAFVSTLACLGSSIERFATEIRHLQRTEVGEVGEGFAPGQKGSSAMPHKRNPIGSENLCGIARLLRGYAQAAFENVPLWHERDISHSSTERVILPDACILTEYMLSTFRKIVEQLEVHPERMLENLERTKGTIYSGHLLIALTDKGMSREEAYKRIQQHALGALDGGPDLRERVRGDVELSKLLQASEIDELLTLPRYLKYVDVIFERGLAS